jgi:hypothetical protein
MQKTRRMLSNFNVINIILAGALLLFLSYGVLPMFGKTARITVPVAKKQPAASVPATEKPGELKTPSPADYVVIADQNLFHPERKIPVENKDAAAPPPPKPEFVLYGTLLTDDLQIAYMEDRKAPQNSPTRGKKQIPVKRGDSLSGFTLKEVGTDRVVMVRGEEKIDVLLNDATIQKDRTVSLTAGPAQNVGVPPHQPQPPASRSAQRPVASQPATPAPPQSPAPTPQSVQSPPEPPPASSGNRAFPAGRDAFMRLFNRR